MIESILQSVAKYLNQQAEKSNAKLRIRSKVLYSSKSESLLQAVSRGYVPSAERKAAVWQRVSLATNCKSESLLSGIAQVITPSNRVKQSIFQRVQEQIVPTANSWLRIDRIKWAAALTTVAFIAAISPRLVVAPPISAESEILLSVINGEVTLYSNNLWSPIQKDIVIKSSASIRTMDGEATISVRDDAVVRLAPYTTLRVIDVADHIDQGSENIATFFVQEGSIWVQGLVPLSFRGTTIQSPHGQFTVHEGSVSLDVQEQSSTIAVWDRSAAVQSAGEKITVAVGERLVVGSNDALETTSIDKNEYSDPWPRNNLAKDAVHRKYIAHIQHERLSALAGTLPTSTFYPVKRLAERVDVLLTFNDEAKIKKQISQASLRLSEAAALLSEGSTEEVVQESLQEYLILLNNVVADYNDSTLSHILVSQSLSDSKAGTAAAKPSDTTYLIKQTVLLASAELQNGTLGQEEDKLTLVSDSLDSIVTEVQSGNFAVLNTQWPSVQSALDELADDGIELSPRRQEVIKMLEQIAKSVEANPDLLANVNQETVSQIAEFFPETESGTIAEVQPVYQAAPEVFLTESDLESITQLMYDNIYIYSSMRGRENQLRVEINSVQDEPEYGRILRALYQKLPAGSDLRQMVRAKIVEIQDRCYHNC